MQYKFSFIADNGLCFDSADKRCVIVSNAGVKADGNLNNPQASQQNYILSVSCFDKKSGHVKWYHGFLSENFYSFSQDEQEKILIKILHCGGDSWNLHRDLSNQKAQIYSD